MAKTRLSELERLDLILEAANYCRNVRYKGMPSSAYSKALREPIHFLWERKLGKSKKDAATYRSKNSFGVDFGKGDLIYDHAIPFKYVQEEILNIRNLNIDNLKSILQNKIVICLITKEEDNALNRLGLKSRMPEDWDYINPLARYEAAKIEVLKSN